MQMGASVSTSSRFRWNMPPQQLFNLILISEPLVSHLRRLCHPDQHPVPAQRPQSQLTCQLHGRAALQGWSRQFNSFHLLIMILMSGESAGVWEASEGLRGAVLVWRLRRWKRETREQGSGEKGGDLSDKEEMFEGLAFLIYFRNLAAPISKLCLLARQWLVEINMWQLKLYTLLWGLECGTSLLQRTNKNIFPGKEILGWN